ncbi:Receptor homology region, transmembrane domain- and RING domain-containing protein 3 [Smittium mucronatum]|uniref:Receptor homology region, transmembrane domain-and RING domain-containing protein 3 n=1 Tax=Smittium mucronatum TaxID=133383 RepID=A0A1R0GPU0_9FUNG|nr:Receptor homology region, transmembrane domain- and RING domain-containing protein 3 [Smittium mucronatum]
MLRKSHIKADDKVLDLESQETKRDSTNVLKFASKVLSDTISAAKNRVSLVSYIGEQEKAELDNDFDCLICFEKMNVGDKVRSIPCSHIFHQECLDRWLLDRMGSCPNCRLDLHVSPVSDARVSDSAETADLPAAVTSVPPAATPNQGARNPVFPSMANIF